jgi:hypothetical protein
MEKQTTNRIWYAIALLICGIMLIVGGVNGAQTIMQVIITVMGVIAIVFGAMAIFSRNILFGILVIILGIAMISFGWTIAWVAFLVNGVMMLIYGIAGLIKRQGIFGSLMNILIGIVVIMIACGNKEAWDFANVFFYIAGGLLAVDSVLVLFRL